MNDQTNSYHTEHSNQGHTNNKDIQNGMMNIGFTEHFNKRTILWHNIISNYKKQNHQMQTKHKVVKLKTRKSVTT